MLTGQGHFIHSLILKIYVLFGLWAIATRSHLSFSTGSGLSGTLGLGSNRSEDPEVAGLFSLITRPLQSTDNPWHCSQSS